MFELRSGKTLRGVYEGAKFLRIKILGQTKIREILENFRLYGNKVHYELLLKKSKVLLL